MAKVIKQALIAALVVFAVIHFGQVELLWTFFGLEGAAAAAALTFTMQVVAGGIGHLTSKGVEASAGNFGTKVATRGAAVARQIIYGQCRVGGTVVHIETKGGDNHRLQVIVVLAGHEIQSVESVRFNDTTLTTSASSGVNYVTNAKFVNSDNPMSGFVGAGHDGSTPPSDSLARFTVNLGNQTSADGLANANSNAITNDYKYLGCAYVYLEVVYDAEKFRAIPKMSFIVKGKKLYDPRDSSTVWSDNPALCIRDYLSDTVYGLKSRSDELNDANAAGGFIAGANSCEVSQSISGGTEERYTANGFTNMSASGEGVLEGLLSSCAGQITYTNGKFNLFVGVAQTPSLTITDDDLLTPPQIATRPSSGDLFNGVKAIYVDSANNYTGTDAPVYQPTGSGTYLALDTPSGEATANYSSILEVQLPFTVTHTMAQRLSRIALAKNRQAATLSVTTTLKFMRCQPGDWVSLTNERLSYSSKVFEVVSTELDIITPSGEIESADSLPVVGTRLALKEIASSIFTFSSGDHQAPEAEGSDVETETTTLTAPSSLVLGAFTDINDGNLFEINFARIQVRWTNAVSSLVTGTEVHFKRNEASNWIFHTIVDAGVYYTAIMNVSIGEEYNIRIRHHGANDARSAWVTGNVTMSGTEYPNTNLLNDQIDLSLDGTALTLVNAGDGVTLSSGSVGLSSDQIIDWTATNTSNIHANNYTNTTYSANQVIDWTGGVSENIHANNYTNTTYSANQVIDWTGSVSENIHTGNYTNTTYSANQVIDWTGSVSSNIHAGNYTNTTYTAGTNMSLSGTEFSSTDTTYAANQVIDWTSTNSANIHAGNYTNTTYSANQVIDWTASDSSNIHANNYTNTTYSAATGSAAGLMPAADYTKLSGVAAGATVNSNFTYSSSTPSNPVDGDLFYDTGNNKLFIYEA